MSTIFQASFAWRKLATVFGYGPPPSPSDRRPGRPNLHAIYSERLPFKVYPLPTVTINPLSIAHILFVLIKHRFITPESIPAPAYEGYFSPATRSVHITASASIDALWRRGFWGKGSLSRSEPAWLRTEQTRRGLHLKGTSEIITGKRRRERRKFKLDRQRAQLKALEEQLRRERGQVSAESLPDALTEGSATLATEEGAEDKVQFSTAAEANPSTQQAVGETPATATVPTEPQNEMAVPSPPKQVEMIDIQDQEHLQLALEEAFFLVYGLGVLRIRTPGGAIPIADGMDEPTDEQWQSSADAYALLTLFRSHSYFPPVARTRLAPDDPFLVQYAVYHHFRSLGWVVRPGLKFACDYLLYLKGPVFSHAEFAVLIVPDYRGPYWESAEGRARRRYRTKDWWRFHCINRVQSHVYKTLVLVYVQVPEPSAVRDAEAKGDVGAVLRQYPVREFCIRRWTPNRNRD